MVFFFFFCTLNKVKGTQSEDASWPGSTENVQVFPLEDFRWLLCQFSSRWYLCAQKSPYALHPVSHKFPQHRLWNSSNICLMTTALSHPFKVAVPIFTQQKYFWALSFKQLPKSWKKVGSPNYVHFCHTYQPCARPPSFGSSNNVHFCHTYQPCPWPPFLGKKQQGLKVGGLWLKCTHRP